MPEIGPFIRKNLGAFEIPASKLFRSLFFSVNEFSDSLEGLNEVQSILEVGAGDGVIAEKLVERFPNADYFGIDIASNPGRLYRGDPSCVRFMQIDLVDLDQDEQFDLVLFVDVLHHIPTELRRTFLVEAISKVRDGGYLMIKDWCSEIDLITYVQYFFERHITGDKSVRYFTENEWNWLLGDVLEKEGVLLSEVRIAPHKNNFVKIFRVR